MKISTNTMTEDRGDELPPVASSARIVVLSLILVSPAFLYGLNLSYPTIASSQMNFNMDDASWFGSVAVYAAPLSSILAGILIDWLGRRTTLLFSIVPSVAGWSLLYYSTSTAFTLAGQMLNGLTAGAVFYPAQVYAGECVMVGDIQRRNTFLAWIGVGVSSGSTVVLALANFLAYRQICAIAFALCLALMLVFFCTIPESPPWLRSRGRHDEARAAEQKLGIVQPKQPPAAPSLPLKPTATLLSALRKLRRPDVYKPLAVLCGSGLLLPMSGMMTATIYMIDFIEDRVPGAAPNTSSPLLPPATQPVASTPLPYVASDSNRYSLLCGLSMCAGSLISSWVLLRIGMRNTIIVANTGAVLGLLALTAAHYADPLSASVLTVAARISAVTLLTFLLGVYLGPICAASGDVFPADAKGYASLVDIGASLSVATANKMYPYLRHQLGGYAFCVYAAASVAGAIYVRLLMPEVVGRTLDEINETFRPAKN